MATHGSTISAGRVSALVRLLTALHHFFRDVVFVADAVEPVPSI